MSNHYEFGVACFPHQEKIVKEYFGFEVQLRVVPMDEIERNI